MLSSRDRRIRRLSCHTPTLDAIPACFMAPRRDRGASKALGKRPAQASQDGQAEARRKARFDTGLFTSVDEYQRYKQHFDRSLRPLEGFRSIWTRRASAAFWTFLWWTRYMMPRHGRRCEFRSERGNSEDVRPCGCRGWANHRHIAIVTAESFTT
ncbi:hypothetical protein AAG906_004859 [Vitis piasezkii]